MNIFQYLLFTIIVIIVFIVVIIIPVSLFNKQKPRKEFDKLFAFLGIILFPFMWIFLLYGLIIYPFPFLLLLFILFMFTVVVPFSFLVSLKGVIGKGKYKWLDNLFSNMNKEL